jgi:large subunit ribosomal protein L24
MKIKKGDKVLVIAGKDRGHTGTILRAMPNESKVLVEGVNVVKRHRKPTAKSRQGQIVERPMPVHVSNVAIVDPKSGKPTRIRYTRNASGVRERVAVKSGQNI